MPCLHRTVVLRQKVNNLTGMPKFFVSNVACKVLGIGSGGQ